jgi:hypothetical protein
LTFSSAAAPLFAGSPANIMDFEVNEELLVLT